MDEEYEESGGMRWRIIILILSVLLVIAGVVLAYFLFWKKPPADEKENRIGYAEGVVAETSITAVDENALQSAAETLFGSEEAPTVALEYKNHPRSSDGEHFTCHMANAADNEYDMYIVIYADTGCTDALFRSERLAPGDAVEELTLERKLETGEHPLTVAFNLVEDGSESVVAQTLITMDFTVS